MAANTTSKKASRLRICLVTFICDISWPLKTRADPKYAGMLRL